MRWARDQLWGFVLGVIFGLSIPAQMAIGLDFATATWHSMAVFGTVAVGLTYLERRQRAPLSPCYEQKEPYRFPIDPQDSAIEHRIGIVNPRRRNSTHHVRLDLVGIAPLPKDHGGQPPGFPHGLQRLGGGDPNIGITVPAGQEELWVLGYTLTGSDGTMSSSNFASFPAGMPWPFHPDENWTLRFQIRCDDAPDVRFEMVVKPDHGRLRIDFW